jgi:hypothetical protein
MSIVSQLIGSLLLWCMLMYTIHISQDGVSGGTWAAMRAGMAAGSTFHTSCCTVISSTSARGSVHRQALALWKQGRCRAPEGAPSQALLCISCRTGLLMSLAHQ